MAEILYKSKAPIEKHEYKIAEELILELTPISIHKLISHMQYRLSFSAQKAEEIIKVLTDIGKISISEAPLFIVTIVSKTQKDGKNAP